MTEKEETSVQMIQESATEEPHTIRDAYRDLRKAQTADERAKFFNIIYGIICTSRLITIFLTLLNLFPIYILIIGSIKLHECRCEHLIPIYMIVEGSVFLARTCVFWYYRWKHEKDHPDLPPSETVPKPAWPNYVINAFLFAWLICGSIWIFRNYPSTNFDDRHDSKYCDRLLYVSGFVYVVMKWVAFPVGLFIGCCILVSSAAIHRAEKSHPKSMI